MPEDLDPRCKSSLARGVPERSSCRSGLLAGAALLEDLDPECKAKMMKVIVVNNFLTKLHTVQKTHVIAVFLLAGSYFISTSFQEHEKIFHLSPSKQWEISK